MGMIRRNQEDCGAVQHVAERHFLWAAPGVTQRLRVVHPHDATDPGAVLLFPSSYRPLTSVAATWAMRVTARSRGVEVGSFMGVDVATILVAPVYAVPCSGVRHHRESRSVAVRIDGVRLPRGEAWRG